MSSAVRRAGTGATVRYLRLRGFPPGISAAVERGLAEGDSERVKGLVLDLRDNTGGLLDEAVKVADAFIKAGTLGSIAGKRETKELVAHDGGHEPAGALVVLVNGRTAEAAELVAAAIKNLGRGVVLGEPTAGAGSVMAFFDIRNAPPRRVPSKDVVQDIIDGPKPPPAPSPVPVDDPLGLLLKTGRLLAAGGAEIEKAGVVPDVGTPCAAAEAGRPEDDCLVQFAHDVVARAQDPSRAAVLSTAKALGGPGYRSRTP
jgi:C-terminal peptidase prc